MALFPFSKRSALGDTDAAATPAEQVQRARTRARRRLIGAVVLLGIGIVGFPLLFETQPPPIPVDVTIDIPRKDAVPPLAIAPPSTTGAPAESSRPRASGLVGGAAPAADTASPPPAADAPPPAATAPAAPSDDGERARALLEARAPVTDTATRIEPAADRFVVQVGAFADRAAAQKTRERVEQLGLKTYTQVVETRDGPRTRVRVGPFGTRDEADKVAAKLKTAGLTAAVLAL